MRESLRQYSQRMDLNWLTDEFDIVKNAPLTPDSVSYGSKRAIWWRCSRNHSWQAMPDNRRRGAHCPYCTGKKAAPGENDLDTLSPALAAEWHKSKNYMLTPADVKPSSKRLVWWQCEKGHEWTASPKMRMNGAGCPICAKGEKTPPSLADSDPALAAQWHPTKNGALTPKDLTIGSSQRVWWQCENGHEWRTTVSDRVGGQRCPMCSGKKIDPGKNELSSVCPELALEWAEENGSLRPTDVTYTSSKRVWWKCSSGHSYRAKVKDRVNKVASCPYCAGRRVWTVTELESKKPVAARERNLQEWSVL